MDSVLSNRGMYLRDLSSDTSETLLIGTPAVLKGLMQPPKGITFFFSPTERKLYKRKILLLEKQKLDSFS